MKEDSSTPLLTVGQETAAFLASCEILFNAWEESGRANNSESFSLKEHGGVTYVAFPSFLRIESFIDGEGTIETNNQIDQLQASTDSRQRKLKPIIFVGHSLGGAVATLATLWFLEKRIRQISSFCITFGCPLVGDERLVEAVGRENWGGNFCHVVSKHDIVPRMFLAPIEAISVPLTAILPYWDGKVPYSSIQDACRILLSYVLPYTSSYVFDSQKRSDRITKRSPYRPVGTYMFCSSDGAACVDNSDTVLKMLHLTMQSHENPSNITVEDCFSEHIVYASVLKPVIENSKIGRKFAFNPDSEFSYDMGISVQLEATGVGAQNDQAQLALRRAGEIEKKYITNVDKLAVQLSQKQSTMTEIGWYKERCEKECGIGYYDTFKEHANTQDIHVDGHRRNLGAFWDDIIEAWEGNELPSDFQSPNKWINAGNTYRRFVEPLDIAHYYRFNGNGNYLSDGRPHRHIVLEKWMEEKERTRISKGRRPRTMRASLTSDSCFWAHVEEAWKDLENLKQGQQQHQSLKNLEKFEEYVTKMENALSISSDVFSAGSRFMSWWDAWKGYKKNQSPDWSSPLYEIMEKSNG
eukprot:PITA_19821